MAAKGVIKGDHIPLNKFELAMLNRGLLTRFTAIRISGIEEELDHVDLPDRTTRSGGRTKPGTIEMDLPMHDLLAQGIMEEWFAGSQDPVDPGYLRPCTAIFPSLTGQTIATYSLIEVFPIKRGVPQFEMGNEGEMAIVTWTLAYSDVIPIGIPIPS